MDSLCKIQDILLVISASYADKGKMNFILRHDSSTIDRIILRNALESEGYHITGCYDSDFIGDDELIPDYEFTTDLPEDVYRNIEDKYHYWYSNK